MADRRTFLLDTSVLHRAHIPAIQERLLRLSEADLLGSCALVRLEVLYSARNRRAYEGLRMELLGLLDAPITETTFARALEVQRELAGRGKHRLPIPDLVIAAAAELTGWTMLHYDADYERISAVTGQAHEWVAPRGSL